MLVSNLTLGGRRFLLRQIMRDRHQRLYEQGNLDVFGFKLDLTAFKSVKPRR